MNKFFFMAAVTANLNGLPQVGFNVVLNLDRRNILAIGLRHIQNAGAQMVKSEGMVEGQDFDNIVIQNIFFLAECTEEEFAQGMFEQAEAEVAADVDQKPAGDVLEPKLELAVDNTASTIDQTSDLSNLESQALEVTPVDDVTTADVEPQGQTIGQGG